MHQARRPPRYGRCDAIACAFGRGLLVDRGWSPGVGALQRQITSATEPTLNPPPARMAQAGNCTPRLPTVSKWNETAGFLGDGLSEVRGGDARWAEGFMLAQRRSNFFFCPQRLPAGSYSNGAFVGRAGSCIFLQSKYLLRSATDAPTWL